MLKHSETSIPMRAILLFGSLLLALSGGAVELLVRIQDKPPLKDVKKQTAGRSVIGMVIVTKPDKSAWGSMEGPPDYAIVKLPGVKMSDAAKYLEPEYEDGTNLVRYRVWKLLVTNMPPALKTNILAGSLAVSATNTITWDILKTNIQKIATGEFETNKVSATP
jgi:hypothetical protein